ncbi:MAG: GntR family transcriptional regulator [Lachnospiraceae bacterium]|nr:GntR family transcriptional regulator [Lachnospiraceae bacterium]
MGEFELNMDDFLPLRDVVFQTLRKAILTGELMPGERLMEIHLAQKLGVSRTPIREAIRKLELEGLVTNIPRRGAQVAEISERGLRDVLEVRRALDTFCAELACERISDEEKEALKEACKDFEDAVETKDATVIAKADVAFHDIIIGATGNERLVALLNNLAEQMYRYRFEYIKDVSQHGKLIEEHRVLMDAILKGNIIGARDAAREHIDNQEKSILMQISIDANGHAKE